MFVRARYKIHDRAHESLYIHEPLTRSSRVFTPQSPKCNQNCVALSTKMNFNTQIYTVMESVIVRASLAGNGRPGGATSN